MENFMVLIRRLTVLVTNGYIENIDLDGDGVDDALANPMGDDASYGAPFSSVDELLTWESIHPELSTYLQPQPFQGSLPIIQLPSMKLLL